MVAEIQQLLRRLLRRIGAVGSLRSAISAHQAKGGILVFSAGLVSLGLLAVPAAAQFDSTRADVTLQVVPRGHGTVVSDVATGSRVCTVHAEPDDCQWTFPSGTSVTLSAKPEGSTAARWSTPDCAGSGDCHLTLDEDTSIVALLGKLTLSVDTTGNEDGDVVTSDTGGISCPPKCEADFDAGATVKLTVTTVTGSTFTSFPYGCASTSGPVCIVNILDQPQSVGVKFNNAQGPVRPPVVKVSVKVRKGGNGAGRVTAGGVDCGSVCSASFEYGDLAVFNATPDASSLFDGWGGVCAADRDPRCSLPIGPITLVRPRFARKAAPPAPGGLTVASRTTTSITLTWDAAKDGAGVKAYEVFVGGEAAPRLSTSSTRATVDELACGKTYAISLDATDAGGNRSPTTTLQAATSPCTPSGLTVASRTTKSITLTWDAAKDGGDVKAYEVFVGEETTPRVSTSSTRATIGGLACSKTYAVSLDATDAGANRSPRTSLQAPTAPCRRALRVSLAGAPLVRGRPAGLLVCRFRSTMRASGSASLVVAGAVTAKRKVVLRAGTTSLVFRLPRNAGNHRVLVVLRLADPGGGTRTFSWSFRIRR